MWAREEWIKFGNISYVGQEDEKRKHSAGMSDLRKDPGLNTTVVDSTGYLSKQPLRYTTE